MSAAKDELKCILLTLQSENVIVPNAAVAEIIPSRNVEEIAGTPDWIMGSMRWRGYDVPLVSFEAAGMLGGSLSTSTQIAVLYSISDNDDLPYMGLAISGVPHVSFFSRNQITEDPMATGAHPMVIQKIRVNGAAASVLDLQAMEKMVREHLPGIAPNDI